MPNTIDWKDNFQEANTNFVEEAANVFGEVIQELSWPTIAEQFPIDGQRLELVLEDDLSEVREQVPGETRTLDGERSYSVAYDVVTKYMAKELGRLRVQADRSGVTGQSLQRFLQRGALMIEKVVWDKLNTNPTGYDGVSLISASHPNGPSGTQSNSTSNAFSDAEADAGVAAMRSLQRENGDYYGVVPSHLYVHPDEERAAREWAEADQRVVGYDASGNKDPGSSEAFGSSITNVYQGRHTVVVTPYLTSGNWLLCDLTKAGIRPWGVGFFREPEAIPATDMDDRERRLRDVFQWFIESDLAHGPLHWQTIYGRLQ